MVKKAVLYLVFGLLGCGHGVKHTGPCQVVPAFNHSSCSWFVRPNNEVFEMCFDNPPNFLRTGVAFKDITYTDDNANMRHFIKAQLDDSSVYRK